MKKTIFAVALLLCSLAISAQEYTHSIGVNVGSMYGVTYKGFIFGVDGLALQADLGVRLGATSRAVSGNTYYKSKGEKEHFTYNKLGVDPVYFTFEANPNIVYQSNIGAWDFGSLSWFAGGGVSLGLMKLSDTWGHISNSDVTGKFGLNAIGGLELCFTGAPLALSFDFRPGYGLQFDSDSETIKGVKIEKRDNMSFFDWGLVLGLRYCF